MYNIIIIIHMRRYKHIHIQDLLSAVWRRSRARAKDEVLLGLQLECLAVEVHLHVLAA